MVEQRNANSDMAFAGGEHQCIPTILIQRMNVCPQQSKFLDESRVPSFARCHNYRESPMYVHTVIAIANKEPNLRPLQLEHVAVEAHGGENLGLSTPGSVFEELPVSHPARGLSRCLVDARRGKLTHTLFAASNQCLVVARS